MSNIAGVPNRPSENRRFSWRIVPAFVLFLCGGFFAIGGASSFAVVLYHAIRHSWPGVATVDPTVNQWAPMLLLSYALMLVSGFFLIVAACWCATGRRRSTLIAAFLGAAAYACFFLVFPGPVPL